MKILIVEDDVKTSKFVATAFREAGFTTRCAMDGEEGLLLARTDDFDVAVVDLMLPKLDGLSLIRRLRETNAVLPIIVLSARDSVESKVNGLEAGGDDYLAKPFSITELLARVQALLRRRLVDAAPMVLTEEDLVLDIRTRQVTRNGEVIPLQPLEFQLLEYFMRNRGRVVGKTTIMEHVWHYDFEPGTNVVEARVCCLRQKIDKDRAQPLIKTVRGFGYVFG